MTTLTLFWTYLFSNPTAWITWLPWLYYPALLYVLVVPVQIPLAGKKPLGVNIIVGFTIFNQILFPLWLVVQQLLWSNWGIFNALMKHWTFKEELCNYGPVVLLIIGAIFLNLMKKASIYIYGIVALLTISGAVRVPMMMHSENAFSIFFGLLTDFQSSGLVLIYIGKLWKKGLLT